MFVFYDMSELATLEPTSIGCKVAMAEPFAGIDVGCLSCIDGYYAARAVGIARRGAVALNARSTWPGVSRV